MKYKYSLNPDNQLIVKSQKQREPITTQGRFDIDQKNRLIYWLNAPSSWRRIFGLPSRIIFSGLWRLNKNHNLELVLDKSATQFAGEVLTLNSEIISPAGDALVFAVKTLKRGGLLEIQILKLTGVWFTDSTNRLSFVIKKHLPDILTLQGEWQLNKNQQIIYSYETQELKTKRKVLKEVEFSGFWQITSANKLTYILKKSTASKFNFSVQVETPTIYPQEGKIKYRLGIGLREEKRSPVKIIALYGAWKFSRKLGFIFEMDYSKGEIKQIEFGAEVNFKRNNEIVFKLKNEMDEYLGISLIFSHRFLKELDAQVFLRLKLAGEERGIDIGVKIPF